MIQETSFADGKFCFINALTKGPETNIKDMVDVMKIEKVESLSMFQIPAPYMIDPLKDVLPVASAPSRFAFLRLA